MEDIGHISLVGSLGLLVFLMDALGLSLSVDDGLEGGGDVQEGTVSGVLKGMSLSFELVAQSKVILFQLNSFPLIQSFHKILHRFYVILPGSRF